jgi:MerR family transcriptional regulator, light-induced transcriptional regulator
MALPQSVTLHEAADRLGVHYQTAYRWVRRGELPAMKVAGIYVVDATDLAAFAAARVVPEAPPRQIEVRDWAHQAARFYVALLGGQELVGREQLDRLRDGGAGVTEVCDRVIAPALVKIGFGWTQGMVSIAEEHRASAICERLLARMTPSPPGRPRGICVVASPPGDDHQLPGAMATAALREDHWQVHHVGIHVPVDQIAALAHAEQAGLIVLSVTYPATVVQGEVAARRLSRPGRRVLVGRPGMSLGDLVIQARGAAVGT